jgi:hypothetical protein
VSKATPPSLSPSCPNAKTQARSYTEVRTSKRLVDYSPRDRPWDTHRAQADQVAEAYDQSPDLERLAERMDACSGYLWFNWTTLDERGETRLRLARARFCRVRHCPVCQWRRALMWQARFLKALPEIQAKYSKARWIFLTLTVRNCPVHELRDTIQEMNRGWQRLIERKRWPALGFVRTTEVTRGEGGTAHPHFHALLMVPGGYFSGGRYLTHAEWVALWQESMRLNYHPMVDVRAVKARKGRGRGQGRGEALEGPQDATAAQIEALRQAAAETLKYATKPEDLASDSEWLAELTRQLRRLRFIATGGTLKDILREREESHEELVNVDDGDDEVNSGQDLGFLWNAADQHYRQRD